MTPVAYDAKGSGVYSRVPSLAKKIATDPGLNEQQRMDNRFNRDVDNTIANDPKSYDPNYDSPSHNTTQIRGGGPDSR